MLKYFVFFCSLLFVLSSCSLENVAEQEQINDDNDIQNYIKQTKLVMQKTPEGMYYSIKASNGTKVAAASDLVKFNYKLFLLEGPLVDSTNAALGQYRHLIFGVTQSLFTPLIQLMKEGDKGTFLLPSGLAFGGSSVGNVPAYSVIRAEVELVSIRTQAEQISDMKKLYTFDKAETTNSGLVFQKITESPTGAAVVAGKLVKLNYVGRLGYSYLQKEASTNKVIYDSKFDANDPAKPLEFAVGSGQVIPGFEEMVLKMKVGEKAKAILPYSIAYGTNGNASIPGYSPLYFEIQIVSIN